ncbi:hypothetical protein BPOR_0015g00120 [Botrytis porri]|uniref:Uncharacterized protein n=1 Tax=Botrytis porri TaxID=87229 RepID=A0A4Z1L521_9HELO|nr:hypothetical protein BPOR_0015g00120 [Botrytis porri]
MSDDECLEFGFALKERAADDLDVSWDWKVTSSRSSHEVSATQKDFPCRHSERSKVQQVADRT